ncbi:MAG: class II aldolase/adducin family protein [Propionibacteriaceae bacterium]|nr:class II aldolase/adducin family protein [Propionibacteriaceae bacterium]
MMLAALREEVLAMNQMLPANRLVVWSGGNVSGRDPETGLIVIKPSGLPYDKLTVENLVVTDIDGTVVEGSLKPSVDLGVHRVIYRNRPDVLGICHTHAPYSTSFAVRGEAIPAALTPLVHMLGTDVPCTRYATPGDEDTGEAVLEAVGSTGMVALVHRHGVFSMGHSASESVKVALYTEEAAMTIRMAQIAGPVTEMDPVEIDRCVNWYKHNYGQ